MDGHAAFPGCEYTEEEIAFMKAIEAQQKRMKTKFLKFTDILKVAKSLGYRKVVETTEGKNADNGNAPSREESLGNDSLRTHGT